MGLSAESSAQEGPEQRRMRSEQDPIGSESSQTRPESRGQVGRIRGEFDSSTQAVWGLFGRWSGLIQGSFGLTRSPPARNRPRIAPNPPLWI